MTQSDLGASKKIAQKIARERAHARLIVAKLGDDAWEVFEARLVLAEDRLAEFKALLAFGRLAARTTERGTRYCLVPWGSRSTRVSWTVQACAYRRRSDHE